LRELALGSSSGITSQDANGAAFHRKKNVW
jgi:hypothetical protein